jgi:hypothetical protein
MGKYDKTKSKKLSSKSGFLFPNLFFVEAYLVVLGLPPQLDHLLIPRFSVKAGSLVGVRDCHGRGLEVEADGRDEPAVDVLVLRERAKALAVLRAVFAPETKRGRLTIVSSTIILS